jgi:TolB-like protein/Tfp pilus assembly protein PilF
VTGDKLLYRCAMTAATDADQPVRFGSFELDLRARELHNGVTRIRLQDQPFEILRMMLERPGCVVTREELQQRLWPDGTFVDFDHSLNAAVKRLRAALGDDAENPRFVETVPRRGYRFIARSEEETNARDAAARLTLPSVRLAVLPFVDLSQEDRYGYFADGLTDEMIAQLGQMYRSRIGVISRSSSMVFRDRAVRAREIGDALRAGYLLEGSVRRQGDRVRITASLVEASSETQLWAETYESSLTDALFVQQDIATRVARSLAVELLPEKREAPVSTNAEAYRAYLKGRYYWNMLADTGVEQAASNLERATQLDPTSAAAHAALARVRILEAEYYDATPRAALKRARESAMRALDLDPSFFEAHLAMGDVLRMLEWDWPGAETAYSQAIVLNPSHEGAHRAYGLLLAALSRFAEAIRESDRACEMDPLCVVVNSSGAAWVRFLAGDYAAAIALSREAIEMEPEYLVARRVLAASYLQSRREREAIAELESALARSGQDSTLIAALAHAKAVTGDRRAAVDLVERLTRDARSRHVPSYHLALAYVGLGETDAALASLEQAIVERDPAVINLAADPRLEPVRSHARCTRLIEQLGV